MRRLGCFGIFLIVLTCLPAGCKSPREHREEADEAAYNIIEQKQKAALGHTEPFTIEKPADTLRRRLLLGQDLFYSHPASLGTQALEPIKHWPDETYLELDRTVPDNLIEVSGLGPVRMTLMDALQVAARNSRQYQQQKEQVYLAALGLDLDRDEFRPVFEGIADGRIQADYGNEGDENLGIGAFPQAGITQRLKNGMVLSGAIALDLVRMLTSDNSTLGISADASVTMPLLSGAGRHIVTEQLTQAERDVVYAIWDFDQFKRTFVVNIATAYLGVLQQIDQLENAENNYRRVITSARLSRAFADAGRLPEIQVDQAIQQELGARDAWINAQLGLQRQLDQFKILLGLPPDAAIELDRGALQELAAAARRVVRDDVPTTQPSSPATQPAGAVPVRPGSPATTQIVATMPSVDEIVLEPPSDEDAGPYELPEARAILLAFENRPDLRIAQGEVFDAQRQVVVAADALQAGLDLQLRGAAGEGRGIGGDGSQPSGELRFDEGTYTGALLLDVPLERTAERNNYRTSLILLEAAVRSLQQFEDELKLDVRNDLRQLLNFRESLQTEAKALAVAQRRVRSTQLFFEAGRAEVRDLLEAQDALVSAQNAFTNALVSYRVAELELQRDLGVLEVSHEGLWQEYQPQADTTGTNP